MIVETLRALYDLAPACDVCEEHRATRERREGCSRWLVCDRADCGDEIMCDDCGDRDFVGPLGGWYCVQCGGTRPRRVPRSTAWRDLPHAAALRAANAAHEAGA